VAQTSDAAGSGGFGPRRNGFRHVIGGWLLLRRFDRDGQMQPGWSMRALQDGERGFQRTAAGC